MLYSSVQRPALINKTFLRRARGGAESLEDLSYRYGGGILHMFFGKQFYVKLQNSSTN